MPFRCRVVSRGAEDEDVDEERGEVDEEGAVEEEASVAGAELSSASSLAMSRTSRIMSCRAVMISSLPPSTEPSTAKFFKILEYTQLTVRQISSGSSQNWCIGTNFTHVPRVSPATSFKLSSIACLQLSLYVAVLLSLMYVVNPVRIGDGGISGSTRVNSGQFGSSPFKLGYFRPDSK